MFLSRHSHGDCDLQIVFLPGGHGIVFDGPGNKKLASVLSDAYAAGTQCKRPAAACGQSHKHVKTASTCMCMLQLSQVCAAHFGSDIHHVACLWTLQFLCFVM